MCVYSHAYVHVYLYVNECMHVQAHEWVFVCSHTHTYVYTCALTCLCARIFVCAYTNVLVCVCICVCTRVSSCAHECTHTVCICVLACVSVLVCACLHLPFPLCLFIWVHTIVCAYAYIRAQNCVLFECLPHVYACICVHACAQTCVPVCAYMHVHLPCKLDTHVYFTILSLWCHSDWAVPCLPPPSLGGSLQLPRASCVQEFLLFSQLAWTQSWNSILFTPSEVNPGILKFRMMLVHGERKNAY
jgi:hypothetical protein